MKDIMVKTTV